MDFTALPSLSGEALTEALALDFAALDNDALAAALTERKTHAASLFALTEPKIAQVNVAEALVASIGGIEAEQAKRDAAVKDAADRFAAARATFSGEGDGSDAGDEGDTEGDASEGDDADVTAAVDPEDEAEGDADETDGNDDAEDKAEKKALTASGTDHTTSQKVKVTTAKRVASRTKRPAVKATQPVTITAAADVQGFSNGQPLTGMEQVAKALANRVKGFAPFNAQAGKAAYEASGGEPQIHPFGVASFAVERPEAMVASGTPGQEYDAVRRAIEDHVKALKATMDAGAVITAGALTAAGWCAPSPIAYNYIADYVVDGLITVPEVGAPRGGLQTTTGPARTSQGGDLDNFGWTQTEAQANAATAKKFETIVCPSFTDHRLDAIGYGYKIPLLTQKAYPELVTDALKFAGVLYAHRANRRVISDIVALASAVTYNGFGPSFTDALEALALIAVAERRRWSVGVNAVMEVKLPVFAQEVFRADMSRRAAVAFDSVSDGQIAKHFADRHLAVEYVADWQETTISGGVLALPGSFTALIYPAGTFVTAREDVVNLSAIYDAASLTVNDYTGVFYEQGYMTFKAGYGASKVVIPVNTAGEMGALTLGGIGDHHDNGSF